ncbi:MAG: HAMP domain-containing sensor histidine kinase, partial [Bacteroidota bacterium]
DVLPKERFAKIAKRMDANIERLKDLVSNILLAGQLDSQKVPYNPQATDVVQLVEEKVVENYIEHERKLHFELSGTPYEMNVDRKLFTQILDNLVNNAYKYSETKSPELKLSFQSDHLLVDIVDHGIGIPEKEQPKLFSSFFRASNVGNVQGSGLGLSIVNEFIKLHNGEINFKSIVNKGTTFTIRFPRKTN